jgi:hypothetical protein
VQPMCIYVLLILHLALHACIVARGRARGGGVSTYMMPIATLRYIPAEPTCLFPHRSPHALPSVFHEQRRKELVIAFDLNGPNLF